MTQAAAAVSPRVDGQLPTTMRVAVLSGPCAAHVADGEVPTAGPGEILVRLEGSGVCASSLPVWEGRPWFDYPREAGSPGHEGWGAVAALGPGVTGPAIGTRVAAISQRAFAEWDVAPAAGIVAVPELLAGQPVPGEPLGCAMNVVRRSSIEPGQTVAVVGIGFLGAILVRLCANAGARVIAISRRPFALEVARAFGADHTIELDDADRVEQAVERLTGGEGCDRAIECVGLEAPLTLAGRLVRVRGRLVIAGFHQDGPRTVDVQRWNWRGLDVVNAHERDIGEYAAGMQHAFAEIAAGRLDPTPLYTHRYSLDEVGEAFTLAQQRPDGFLKALVLT